MAEEQTRRAAPGSMLTDGGHQVEEATCASVVGHLSLQSHIYNVLWGLPIDPFLKVRKYLRKKNIYLT